MRQAIAALLRRLAAWIEPSSLEFLKLRLELHVYGKMRIVKVEVAPAMANAFFSQLEDELRLLGQGEFVPKTGASPDRRYFGPCPDETQAHIALVMYREFANERFGREHVDLSR